MYLNKLLLKGRVGAPPESGQTGEHVFCRFSVATKRGDHVEWHKVVAYGKLAGVCKSYGKGDWVFLECFINTRESLSEGRVRKITDLVVENAHLVEKRCGDSAAEEPLLLKEESMYQRPRFV